ncbi:hypothetical protein [Micromonospora pallida]|uniref:biotin synthase auxiliary protein BsaP n=1 Tax=Micromonospora pallida TaxID=145854 RepID=UPI000B857F71|nr:hypothetical protein [Micromonospora pallida]
MDGAAPGGTAVVAEWCDRCGEPEQVDTHEACRAARTFEPPRFCAYCRRRMKVQVLPTGWRATCVEHGPTEG